MNYVDLSIDIEFTDDHIRGRHKLEGDLNLGLRVAAALHESAHLVASCACPMSSVTRLTIASSAHGNIGRGSFDGYESWPDHSSFVSLVGYAWEEAYGDSNCAGSDYRRGFNPRRAYVLDDARAFVKANRDLIYMVARAVLQLIPKHGRLEGKRLAGLVKQVREIWVTDYISGFVSGKLNHSVAF